MEVKEKIIQMLTENVGRAMGDSGGYPKYDDEGNYIGSEVGYGRHYERNQCIKDWDKLPILTVNYQEDDEYIAYFSLNIYHYLVNFLNITEKSEQLNKEFKMFSEKEGNEDKSWLKLIEEFTNDFEECWCCSEEIINTYNYDTILSQNIQYSIFHSNKFNADFIILQTHNGCDVRGGYSTPYIFQLDDVGSFLIAQSDLSADEIYLEDTHPKLFEVEPTKDCNKWYSDDCGYHWYNDYTDVDLLNVLDYNEEKDIWFNTKTGNEIKFYSYAQ